MEGAFGGRPIGEPVAYSPRPGEAPLKDYPTGDVVKVMRRVTIKRMGVTLPLIALMIFTVVFILTAPFAGIEIASGASLLQALYFLFIMQGVLCFCFVIAVPISIIAIFVTLGKASEKMGRMRVWTYKDRLTISSASSYAAPETIVHVPYASISGVRRTERRYWDGLMKATPAWFRFMYRRPWQPAECLFSLFSDPEDLITIELRSPIVIERMLWPSRILEVASTGQYRVDRLVVDIDKRRHEEFLREMEDAIGGDER